MPRPTALGFAFILCVLFWGMVFTAALAHDKECLTDTVFVLPDGSTGSFCVSVDSYQPPLICDVDEPPIVGCICDNDPTTDLPPCRLPEGCTEAGDTDAGLCTCTTDITDDELPDCPVE